MKTTLNADGNIGIPAEIRETDHLPEAKAAYTQAAEQGDLHAANHLAWLLATCKDHRLRNGADAVAFAERAVDGTGRKNSSSLVTLAAAYAETGQFERAISAEQEALALVKLVGQKKSFNSGWSYTKNEHPSSSCLDPETKSCPSATAEISVMSGTTG
jgi:tetratricopeptide (TPR) repeat protein